MISTFSVLHPRQVASVILVAIAALGLGLSSEAWASTRSANWDGPTGGVSATSSSNWDRVAGGIPVTNSSNWDGPDVR